MTHTEVAPTNDRALLFLGIAAGVTIVLQAPFALAAHGVIPGPAEQFLPFAMLGTFSPIVTAVLLSRGQPGGVRGLFSTLKPTSAPFLFTLIALLVYPLCWIVPSAIAHALGHTEVAWLYPPENGQHVAALFMIPLVEEPGWRGFALPRLVRRFGPVQATLIVGAGWAAWHLCMFAGATTSIAEFVISIVNIFAGAFVFTWLAQKTKHSLWIAVVAHFGAHLNNPSHAKSLFFSMSIYTAAICVLAVALVILDRPAWKRAS
jgi:membrane protease YdiL (CAAX protease family)